MTGGAREFEAMPTPVHTATLYNKLLIMRLIIIMITMIIIIIIIIIILEEDKNRGTRAQCLVELLAAQTNL